MFIFFLSHCVMQFEVRDNVQISLPQTPRMKFLKIGLTSSPVSRRSFIIGFMTFYTQTLVETWHTENTNYATA